MFDKNFLVYGSFYSHAEFRLCRNVYDVMRKKNHDVYIGLTGYRQDHIFANRLCAFLKSSKSYPVIFNASLLDPLEIIPHLLSSILGKNDFDSLEQSFSQMLLSLFQNGQKIIVIFLNSEQINSKIKLIFQHLSQIIYEKFPNKKNQSLFRFVYCGEKENYIDFKYSGIYPTDFIEDVPLTMNDCHNASLFYNSPLSEEVIYYSTAQSFTALRLLLPTAILPSHKDNFYENINFYAKIIYDQIDISQQKKKFHLDFHENVQNMQLKQSLSEKKDWKALLKGFNLTKVF